MRDLTIASRDRLPSLTGLRFWAALLVVLYHLSRSVGQLPILSDLTWYGRCGVTFFFVLSGFVLAWTYDGTHTSARVFYWRRFARIWPLMAFSILLSAALYVLLDQPVSLAAVIAGLTMVNAWFPDPAIVGGGNPAVWSLSDEAFFYLVFPLLLLFLATRSRRCLLAVAAAGCVAAALAWLVVGSQIDPTKRVWALDYLPLTRMTEFAVGVALALAMRRGWRPPVSLPVALMLTIAYLAALVPWHRAVPDAEWAGPYSASQLLSTGFFALVIAAAAHADLSGRRTGLSGTWMLRLGHWSYAWYLVHALVIRWVLSELPLPIGSAETLLMWTMVMLTSLALAATLYHLLEHPAERLLRGIGPQPRPVSEATPRAAGRGR